MKTTVKNVLTSEERCFPALERFANEIGMFITESIEDETRLKELVK